MWIIALTVSEYYQKLSATYCFTDAIHKKATRLRTEWLYNEKRPQRDLNPRSQLEKLMSWTRLDDGVKHLFFTARNIDLTAERLLYKIYRRRQEN